MKRISFLSILFFVGALFLQNCTSTTSAELEEVALLELNFNKSEYSVDEVMIISAKPSEDIDIENYFSISPRLKAKSSSGTEYEISISPYQDISDRAIVQLIRDFRIEAQKYDDYSDEDVDAMVRVKDEWEATIPRDEYGGPIYSENAVESFSQWLKNHDELEEMWASQFVPWINIRFLTEPTEELVREIREQENYDLIEPNDFGEWYVVDPNKEGQLPAHSISEESLVSEINPIQAGFKIGDVITVEYNQPDGSILKSTAKIIE